MFVRSPTGRKRYNVLGAINAITKELVTVTNHSYINSTSVCELLHQIAKLKHSSPITLVLDNASYQRCQLVQSLAQQLQIELLFLPSYSPNLNLIERLWKIDKKKALYSRHHASFAEFQQAIDECLTNLTTTYKNDIDQLMTPRFQVFTNVPFLTM